MVVSEPVNHLTTSRVDSCVVAYKGQSDRTCEYSLYRISLFMEIK